MSDDKLDATIAVTLLIFIVVVPPLTNVRMMYTACWLVFSAAAHLFESHAALGISTSMGITIMIGWYTLRIYDRYAFTAIMNGWVGRRWAKSRALTTFARSGDLVIHFAFPIMMFVWYKSFIRYWMAIPALLYVEFVN